MKYREIADGIFVDRPNRFIAHVEVNGAVETVHVKNTGRCRELLLPGTAVRLEVSDNPKRKTKYDLVAVHKQGLGWVNMDSQAPNKVVGEWLAKQGYDYIKPEFTYGKSRIDFYMEKGEQKYLMEVKGCTLEVDGIGYFPDAPTERGVKHLHELAQAQRTGYQCAVAFVIQMEGITEVLPLLDELDPLGDLQKRMGLDGQNGKVKARQSGQPGCKDRVFAIVTRFPTPGCQYYPVPYYSAIFRDKWYDISRLIAIGKMAKLKNHATIPYLVEIHNDYWRGIFKEEHITSTEEQKKRKLAEKEKIRDFISGIENSGKLWIAGYYTTPDGKEVKMVRITRIDTSKDGGDYSDDIAESNNMQCYADNIHPNLVGATPGKSQSNNSGSDKRELFTLKQSIEKAFHDLMETVHWVIIYFNHWEEKVYPDVPLIMLTTLDENKDAKKVSNNPNSQTDD